MPELDGGPGSMSRLDSPTMPMPERLRQSLGRGHADPQAGEEPGTQVDRHGAEVAGIEPHLSEQMVQRRDQRLDVTATPGQREFGLTPPAVRTATPTVSVAVSMATMFTAPPPAASRRAARGQRSRPVGRAHPPAAPCRVIVRRSRSLGCPTHFGQRERDLEDVVAQGRGSHVPPFDQGDGPFLHQLGQGQLDHLAQGAVR